MLGFSLCFCCCNEFVRLSPLLNAAITCFQRCKNNVTKALKGCFNAVFCWFFMGYKTVFSLNVLILIVLAKCAISAIFENNLS